MKANLHPCLFITTRKHGKPWAFMAHTCECVPFSVLVTCLEPRTVMGQYNCSSYMASAAIVAAVDVYSISLFVVHIHTLKPFEKIVTGL